MTQRERKIGIAVAVIAAAAGIYLWVVSPYLDMRGQQDDNLKTLQQQIDDNNNLLDRQNRLRPVWTKLQNSGLFATDTEAESQALHAAVNWALSAGLDVTALTSPHSVKNGEFQVISFRIEATGSMRQIDRLMWGLENASIPLRVTDAEIDTAKEGTDALKAEIGLSTLSWNPPVASAQPDSATPTPEETQ